MSTDSNEAPRQLPARPNLHHLKNQAKDLLKVGGAASLSEAQFATARQYGFPSWPKLKKRVEWLEELHGAADVRDTERIRTLLNNEATGLVASGDAASIDDAELQVAQLFGLTNWDELEAGLDKLKQQAVSDSPDPAVRRALCSAIDADDVAGVKAMMIAAPELHKAPMGYGRSGPLTYLAECSVPPTAATLEMAAWMIEHGSDVHQGGDGPLMRAALRGGRIPMMELLVSHGADVNAEWKGEYPVIFAACEGVDPVSLAWLLEHGANPNCDRPLRAHRGTALDYVIGTYVRSANLAACIDLLVVAGGVTKYDQQGILDLLCGRLDRLELHLAADERLVSRRFSGLDCGATGGRLLTLDGATLLHVAAEYRNEKAIDLLLGRGADVNGRAAIDAAGVGGQTPLFHAVTQADAAGVAVTRQLIDRGADVNVRARVPGHYERPGKVIECTPLGYAAYFQSFRSDEGKTVALLQERGAVE